MVIILRKAKVTEVTSESTFLSASVQEFPTEAQIKIREL
jgi:hypothetical protein